MICIPSKLGGAGGYVNADKLWWGEMLSGVRGVWGVRGGITACVCVCVCVCVCLYNHSYMQCRIQQTQLIVTQCQLNINHIFVQHCH